MTSELRKCITLALELDVSIKNASKCEKAIYNMCLRIAEETEDDIDDVYAKQAYEKVGEFVICECEDDIEKVLEDIEGDVEGFDSVSYSEIRDKAEMDARILTEGVKVKKGEIPCKKCKSTETYYYSVQTRGGDEGQSLFYGCAKCGNKGRLA